LNLKFSKFEKLQFLDAGSGLTRDFWFVESDPEFQFKLFDFSDAGFEVKVRNLEIAFFDLGSGSETKNF
jgi:hypothetical protein